MGRLHDNLMLLNGACPVPGEADGVLCSAANERPSPAAGVVAAHEDAAHQVIHALLLDPLEQTQQAPYQGSTCVGSHSRVSKEGIGQPGEISYSWRFPLKTYARSFHSCPLEAKP